MRIVPALLATCVAFLSVPTRADDEAVPASTANLISADVAAGRDSYRALGLDLGLAVDEMWALAGSLDFVRASYGDTTGGSGGVRGSLSDVTQLWIDLEGRKEPESLSYFGGAGGLSWTASSLWGAQRRTILGFSGSAGVFRRGLGLIRASTLAQRSLTLSLSQELFSFLEAGASVSGYAYSKDPSVILSRLQRRLVPLPGAEGVISGLPESGASADLRIFPVSTVTVSSSLSTSRSASDGSRTNTLTLGVSWQADRAWSVGVSASGSRTSGITSAGSAGISLGYYW